MTMEFPWEDLLTETDREVIKKGGYGRRRGLGSRPALLLIDPQYNYLGEDRPVLDQIEDHPSGVGRAAWRAVPEIKRILSTARARGIPVFYTRQVHFKADFDNFALKAERDSSQYRDGARGTRIVDELAPEPGEPVIDKTGASAFSGTPLSSYLVSSKIDSLIILGGTTGGCVRATAVDAVSSGYDTTVVRDCVFDRIELSHKAALLDLWMKYCDLMSSDEVVDYLNGL